MYHCCVNHGSPLSIEITNCAFTWPESKKGYFDDNTFTSCHCWFQNRVGERKQLGRSEIPKLMGADFSGDN